jgi:predicted membrane-bound spermidine synthase
MARKSFYFEIFAVSLAAILLEISYTRIFSYKVFYFFTYLIIGVALLGLGAGGVSVAVSRRLREADPSRLISKLCLVSGASVLAGYFIIAPTQLNISSITSDMIEVPKLAGICLALIIPFFMTGVVISTILSVKPEIAGRLYGTDLLGAALGCVICIPLMTMLGPPKVIIISGLIFSIAGLRRVSVSYLLAGCGGLLCGVSLLTLFVPGLLPDQKVGNDKSYNLLNDSDNILFSKWHPIFRVDVTAPEIQDGSMYLLHHDGLPGSAIRRFDGDVAVLEYLDTDSRALPFEVTPDAPRVLIIGAAGGHEILASLYFGASHVTGVELNPVTVSLLTDTYADMTGRLHEDPRVDLINGEGRWFMKQSEEEYDLIWFVAPDSYANMNASSSGAFVLSESYLFTVEMLRESLSHLTDKGIISVMFGEFNYEAKPNRTTRYLSTARRAFADMGIEAFEQHVMVSSSSAVSIIPFGVSTIILSKSPFTRVQVGGFGKRTRQITKGRVRYLPGKPLTSSPVSHAILLPDSHLTEWYSTHRYKVDPVYDNSPYFWHFSRFRDALTSPLRLRGDLIDYTDSVGEQISSILLVLVTVFALFFLLLPFLAIRKTWKKIPYKWKTGVYFCSLGLGFMFIEVALIQMFTLFLGYPTHSLSVTLFAMLLFSGFGSLLSERLSARRTRALGILVSLLAGLIVFYNAGLPFIIDLFVGHPIWLRSLLAIVLIAPLGLCLGTFMPIGLKTIAWTTPHKREYIAWAWAVNCFFSVMASILSTILAMVVGFKFVLFLSVAIYIIGALALSRLPQPADS